MIRVERPAEPEEFDDLVRTLGNEWRQAHPGATDCEPYWTDCKPQLAQAFDHRCGYTAQFISDGTVDHFLAQRDYPSLIYDWSNYRYAGHTVQSKKKPGREWLDPFEVRSGWFAISLPDLQLYVTDQVPPDIRELAEDTIDRLGLKGDYFVMKQREDLFADYRLCEIKIGAVRRRAPLLADAIERELANGKDYRFNNQPNTAELN